MADQNKQARIVEMVTRMPSDNGRIVYHMNEVTPDGDSYMLTAYSIEEARAVMAARGWAVISEERIS